MNESEWIDLLKKSTKPRKDLLVGIGDDCALVKLGKTKALLKSDLFIEDVHFKRRDSSFKTIGSRAVSRILSDFAACGGRAKFIGVSIGVPKSIGKRELKEILEGVLSCARKYKFSLVGGDTSRARKLFLDVWGLGVASKFISRSAAKVGDYIFITNTLGQRAFNKVFLPRLKEAGLLRNFKINSMIDVSDGFIIDMHRILKESKKGALIEKSLVPTTRGESDLWRGEDYELIFTVDKGEKRINCLKKRFHYIGRITSKNSGYKMINGKVKTAVKIKGYRHF